MNKTYLIAITVAVTAQLAYADMPLYRATQFSLPWDVSVFDANSRGDVVYTKEFEGTQRTFVRSLNGDTTMLPNLPGAFAVGGIAINDQGVVAVQASIGIDSSMVLTWHESTGFTPMPDLPAPIDGNRGPTDITNSGIVSWNTYAEISQVNARGLWNTHTNEITYLPNTAGGNTQIQNLSEGGYAVATGYFSRIGAVYHPDGSSYQLRSSATYLSSFNMNGQRVRVSDDGMVVSGAIVTINGVETHATYVWDRFGQVIEERIAAGYGYSGISGDGLIIGNSYTEPNRFRPFLYDRGGPQILVDSRIVERNFSGDLFGSPLEIFDNHAIFHQVHPGNAASGHPEVYVFLEPVPEPATVLALGAGLAALLRRKRTT